MRICFIVPLAALALASCGKGSADSDGDGKVTMAEAAEASDGEIMTLEPGQYRATSEILDMRMPGADPEMQAMLKNSMQKASSSTEYCLKKEDVRSFKDVLAKDQGECTFDRYDVVDGSIDAAMQCRSADRGSVKMTMKGKVTSTSSDMTMTTTVDAGDGAAMETTMRSVQTRIGDCKA